MKLKSGIVLGENENVVMELEAELWATSQNPIAQIIGQIKKLLGLFLGIKREGFVVITDKRVVEVFQTKACWVLNTGKVVTYLMPNSIKECGYTKEGTVCGCFCQGYTFYYEAWTQQRAILLKDADEKEAQGVVDSFYKALLVAGKE
jgi:hypothetical protein